MKSLSSRRPLKFRAQDRIGHIVITVELGKDDPARLSLMDPETICQYTGLKDRQGKEVYEGDVVVARFGPNSHVGVVQYDADYGQYVAWDEYECGARLYDVGCIVKVLGHIFEDPKLKKKYWEVYSK